MTRINAAEAGGLQQALDALPESGGTVFLPAGKYVVSKTIEKQLAEGQHLFLVGEGRATVVVNENEEGADLLRIAGVLGEWWPDQILLRRSHHVPKTVALFCYRANDRLCSVRMQEGAAQAQRTERKGCTLNSEDEGHRGRG